ncbi:MAG: HugZ family pyridoxamine 5'-phosphate oxidase [Paracoccaceae bacterium]
MEKSSIRPTDDQARALAYDLLANTTHAALAVIHPETKAPFVTRIALALSPDGIPMSLISTLAFHTGALQKNPICSLLIGDPPDKGDPLAFPRLSLSATAEFIAREDDALLRAHYIRTKPKSKLYIDFADFGFVLFHPSGAALNGGFGKAYALSAADLKK